MSETRQPQDEKRYDPLDPEQQEISEGTRALEAVYNSREVSLPMLLVGAVIIAALAGILVAFTLFNGS
jgi:hypothetical protein